MLYGDMTHMGTHIGGEVKAITRDGLTGLTYAQMSEQTGRAGLIKTENNADWWLPSSYKTFKDALNQNVQNGPFDWVSVEENNASIHGKYSFPGSDSELRGPGLPLPDGADADGYLRRYRPPALWSLAQGRYVLEGRHHHTRPHRGLR